MTDNHIIVLVTTANKTEAEEIVKALLNEKLIACANIIGPAYSLFWWQGKIEKAQEHIILMKTRKNLFSKLSEKIKSLHSYELPEIIAIPIIAGSKAYLEWLNKSLG